MSTYGDRWRGIFEAAASAFVEVVDQIPPDRYGDAALGTWSLRDLVGHTSRALLTVEMYLARQPAAVSLDSPVAYLVASSASGTSAAGSEAIAQRGRDAGIALGPDPAASVRAIAHRLTALVDRTADDAPLATPFGGISLASYLPTRALELTVHTLDILGVLGTPAPDVLGEPTAACLHLVAEVVGATPAAADVLLALVGRRELPRDLHVV